MQTYVLGFRLLIIHDFVLNELTQNILYLEVN